MENEENRSGQGEPMLGLQLPVDHEYVDLLAKCPELKSGQLASRLDERQVVTSVWGIGVRSEPKTVAEMIGWQQGRGEVGGR
jgi:hypothetical protein